MRKLLGVIPLILISGCIIVGEGVVIDENYLPADVIYANAAKINLQSAKYRVVYTSTVNYALNLPMNKVLLLNGYTPYVLEDGFPQNLSLSGDVYAFYLDIKPSDNYGSGTLNFINGTDTFTLYVSGREDCINVNDFRGAFYTYGVEPGEYKLSFTSDLTSNGNPINHALIYNTTDSMPDGWFYVVGDGEEISIYVDEYGIDADSLFITVIAPSDPEGQGELLIE